MCWGRGVNSQGAETLMGFSDNKGINNDFPFLRYIPLLSGEIIYFGLTGKPSLQFLRGPK